MLRYTPLLAAAGALLLLGAAAVRGSELPFIGAAPSFSLRDQEGRPLALADLRGKVVVVDFIFTSCADTCPLQTHKLAMLRPQLDSDTYFVSITLDPQHDSSAALRDYAQRQGADLRSWSFLTGDPGQIRQVARGYGVVARRAGQGELIHNTLTSVIDRKGVIRVQYQGAHYDPAELRADIRSLIQERGGP